MFIHPNQIFLNVNIRKNDLGSLLQCRVLAPLRGSELIDMGWALGTWILTKGAVI